MPKIRNVSDDARVLRDGRTVEPDSVIEVEDDEVAGYECQPRLWRVEAGRKAASKDEVA
jgi:ABC-type sugar transport system ATPase subunit